MPRETIYSDVNYNASVGWWPDRDVQVGVCTVNDGVSLLMALYSDEETLTKIGRNAADAFGLDKEVQAFDYLEAGRRLLAVVEDAGHMPYEGVWTTLGHREDVNRLIRVLRKARDAAFGRDE